MNIKTTFDLGSRFLACRLFGRRYPLAIALELTHKCNLTCPHCYNTDLKKTMGREDHLKLLDEMYEAGCRVISFTGGEPLLIKYLPDLMVRAKELGMWVQYTTNGTYLPERENEMIAAGPDMIQVSVDGDRHAHEQSRGEGAFNEAMAALDIVKKNNWRCLLVSVIHKESSLESITFVLSKALDIGAFVSFQPLCDYGEMEPSEEHLSSLLDFLREIRKVKSIDGFKKVLSRHNTVHVFEEVFKSRRPFYNPMDQSMTILKHLYKNPTVKYVPCTGGRLFGRVMPDGQLISCYAAIDENNPNYVTDQGFKQAWKNIILHTGKELHHHRLELNLIYALSVPTIFYVLYYHLNKKYYKLNGR